MKKIVLATMLLLVANVIAFAQDDNEQKTKSGRTGKNTFQLNTETSVTDPEGNSITAGEGLKFKVLAEETDGYLVKFLPITSEPQSISDDVTKLNINNDDINYKISKSDFDNNTYMRGKIITTTLILPIKLRFKLQYDTKSVPFTAVSDVTVGPLLGYRFNLDRSSDFTTALTFGVFAGPTLINVNTSNLHNPEKFNTDGENNINNILGFSWGGAAVVQLKEFQVGVVYGWDYATGDMGSNWVYDQKPWASIAVGYRFLEK